MKRVLVTGATGFVGANLARRLLRDGHEVHLLVRHGHQSWRIDEIRPHFRLHEADLGDSDTLSALVGRMRPDWVFHLAAYGAYSSQTELPCMVQTNIVATMNLVEACLKTGFEAFINTGSSSEYGLKDHPPAETEWLEPNSGYAVTKASATMYCRYIARTRHVPLTTLRLYSIFGPYEEPTRLMPTLIEHGLRGELPPLVNPEIARDFVYTEDINDAYMLAAMTPGQEHGAVYNAGSGRQTTLREVVDVARRVLGINMEPHWDSMPARLWDTTVWVADNQRIRTALGWRPRHTFEDGFRRMVEWTRCRSKARPRAAG
jgi:nucleoside-diphosphate-sugar epimerase